MSGPRPSEKRYWREVVRPFEQPDPARSLLQLANTLIPFFGLLYLMYQSLTLSYGLTLALTVPTALFYVRIFVLFHDCTHCSLFRSRAANYVVGSLLGVIVMTPYFHWRTGHGTHHASTGNLDRRSSAEIWTMTVQEYLSAPLLLRLAYRGYRHPFTLFVLGPILKWSVRDRIPTQRGKRERWSVHGTNLALLALLGVAHGTIGLKAFFLVIVPPAILASSMGIWLFYVQHTFEDTYWERQREWQYELAALRGSSFYKLPALLQWFTASIGYHHVHHLSPRIPNYRLQQCHEAHPLFRAVPRLTPRASLEALSSRLWDEEGKRLVGWDHARRYRGTAGSPPVGAEGVAVRRRRKGACGPRT